MGMRSIEFNVGDKVRILTNSRSMIIKMGKKGPGWSERMSDFIGHECIVTKVNVFVNSPATYDLCISRVNSSPVFCFPGKCIILLERAKTEPKQNSKVATVRIENPEIPSMHGKEVVYTVSLEVRPENYEQTVEKIIESGEIISGALPNRIPICAKIYVSADADGVCEMKSIIESIEECDVTNFNVDNIEIRKIPVGHK